MTTSPSDESKVCSAPTADSSMVNNTDDGDRSNDHVAQRPPSFLSFPDAKPVTAIKSFSSFPDLHNQPKASTSRHTLDDHDDGEARSERKKRRRADREHEERKHRKSRALTEHDGYNKAIASEEHSDHLRARSGLIEPAAERRRSREGRSSRSQEVEPCM